METKGSGRVLSVLAIALVLAMTTWFSASAVIPQLRAEWSLSDGDAAWLTIAVQIGFVIGALVASVTSLADIVAPSRLIFLGAVGAAAANLGLVVSSGAGTAIPLRMATGFFLAGVYPPSLKLIATWFRERRGAALGLLVGALTVGSAVPHLVNGLGGLRWEVVVYATSALTFTGGVLAATISSGPYPFARAVFDPRQARLVLRDRGVRLASLGYFGHMWELYAMWAWFLIFFRTVVGAGESTTPAFATFAVIGIGGLGCYLAGLVADRWGRTNVTVASMAISGGCAVTIGLISGGPSWIVLLVGLVWGFAVVADSAQFSTMVTELATGAYVGTALTLQLAIGFTLTVATIWLIPLLEDAVTWRWAFAFLVPGPLLGIIAMIRLRSSPYA
ncbi:MAG: MFS transporter, partial [Actinomycetota bacterium]